MKTYLYNFDPHKPHLYIVKLELTGVYIIFLISAQDIDVIVLNSFLLSIRKEMSIFVFIFRSVFYSFSFFSSKHWAEN